MDRNLERLGEVLTDIFAPFDTQDSIGHGLEHMVGVVYRVAEIAEIVNSNPDRYVGDDGKPIEVDGKTAIITGLMHDVGNLIGRSEHGLFGQGIVQGGLSLGDVFAVPLKKVDDRNEESRVNVASAVGDGKDVDLGAVFKDFKESGKYDEIKILQFGLAAKATFEIGYSNLGLDKSATPTRSDVQDYLLHEFGVPSELSKQVCGSMFVRDSDQLKDCSYAPALKDAVTPAVQAACGDPATIKAVAEGVADHNKDWAQGQKDVERYDQRSVYGMIVADADKDTVPKTADTRTMLFAINKDFGGIAKDENGKCIVNRGEDGKVESVLVNGKDGQEGRIVPVDELLSGIVSQAWQRERLPVTDQATESKMDVPAFEGERTELQELKGVAHDPKADGIATPLIEAIGRNLTDGEAYSVAVGDDKLNDYLEKNEGATMEDVRSIVSVTDPNADTPIGKYLAAEKGNGQDVKANVEAMARGDAKVKAYLENESSDKALTVRVVTKPEWQTPMGSVYVLKQEWPADRASYVDGKYGGTAVMDLRNAYFETHDKYASCDGRMDKQEEAELRSSLLETLEPFLDGKTPMEMVEKDEKEAHGVESYSFMNAIETGMDRIEAAKDKVEAGRDVATKDDGTKTETPVKDDREAAVGGNERFGGKAEAVVTNLGPNMPDALERLDNGQTRLTQVDKENDVKYVSVLTPDNVVAIKASVTKVDDMDASVRSALGREKAAVALERQENAGIGFVVRVDTNDQATGRHVNSVELDRQDGSAIYSNVTITEPGNAKLRCVCDDVEKKATITVLDEDGKMEKTTVDIKDACVETLVAKAIEIRDGAETGDKATNDDPPTPGDGAVSMEELEDAAEKKDDASASVEAPDGEIDSVGTDSDGTDAKTTEPDAAVDDEAEAETDADAEPEAVAEEDDDAKDDLDGLDEMPENSDDVIGDAVDEAKGGTETTDDADRDETSDEKGSEATNDKAPDAADDDGEKRIESDDGGNDDLENGGWGRDKVD